MYNLSQCPLCNSRKIKIIDKIDTAELLNIYKNSFNINCKNLLEIESIQYLDCTICNLKFFSPAVQGDEIFYSSLQKNEWYYLNDKGEYLNASTFINPGNIVLDVGCGQGEFANYVFENDAKFIGLESSENAKRLAKTKDIDILNLSIQSYALDNPESVDIVTSFQVLEHVNEPKSFIEAKLKALRSEGLMIIAVPSEDSFIADVTNGVLNMPPHHLTRWSDKTLEFIANFFDLELVSLTHEKVETVHTRLYWNTVIQSYFLKPKLIDTSFKRKVISKGASLVSKVIDIANVTPKANGHSVIAVYKKK